MATHLEIKVDFNTELLQKAIMGVAERLGIAATLVWWAYYIEHVRNSE